MKKKNDVAYIPARRTSTRAKVVTGPNTAGQLDPQRGDDTKSTLPKKPNGGKRKTESNVVTVSSKAHAPRGQSAPTLTLVNRSTFQVTTDTSKFTEDQIMYVTDPTTTNKTTTFYIVVVGELKTGETELRTATDIVVTIKQGSNILIPLL
jgi:hypothetical protein